MTQLPTIIIRRLCLRHQLVQSSRIYCFFCFNIPLNDTPNGGIYAVSCLFFLLDGPIILQRGGLEGDGDDHADI